MEIRSSFRENIHFCPPIWFLMTTAKNDIGLNCYPKQALGTDGPEEPPPTS